MNLNSLMVQKKKYNLRICGKRKISLNLYNPLNPWQNNKTIIVQSYCKVKYYGD